MAAAIVDPLFKTVGITAAVLGIIQGLGWTILSLASILSYYEVLELYDYERSTYDGNISSYGEAIYTLYFQRDSLSFGDTIYVNPTVINGYSWAYIFTSFGWFVSSLFQSWVLYHGHMKYLLVSFGVWSFITAVTSIGDIVLMSLLANDLSVFNDEQDWPIILACGTLMTIAAKGYILWILNVVLVVVLIKFAIKLNRSNNPERQTDSTPIHAYESTRSPDPWQTSSQSVSRNDLWSYNPRPSSVINQAFDFTDEREGFERSQSFHQLDGDDYQRGEFRSKSFNRGQPTPFSASSQKVASIGRRKRTPPGQPRKPAIPPPDYTPPGSPSFGRKQPLKSVLKSRSQYM